jgi:hypothetical protein
VPEARPSCRPAALIAAGLAALAVSLGLPSPARAGKLAWLDEVVHEVVKEAEASGKTLVRGADEVSVVARGSERLFVHEGEESLEILARRSDDLARAGRRGVEATTEAALQKRFARLVPRDVEGAKTFAALAPAEKRLVVEMGETAQLLAHRYPGQAERMIKELGTEGMSAVRVFGDDVAEVLVKEGPQSVGILRKTGRGGWEFFTSQVLPHKKKLIAAGVMAAFLADPDKFVDYAGRATEYAVREFAKAGVTLAGAVTGGAARGLESSIAEALKPYGLNFAVFRYLGMALAGLVALAAAMVLLGLPLRWMLRPVTWPVRMVLGRRKAGATS